MSTTTESDQADSQGHWLNHVVAAEIRAWLGRRDLTQTGVASALGRNAMWVRRRLAGDQALTLTDLQRFAEVLDVDPIDLFPTAELPIVQVRRPRGEPGSSPGGLDRGGNATHANHPRPRRGSTVTRVVRWKPRHR